MDHDPEIVKNTGAREFLNGDFADDRALLVPERAALQWVAGHLDHLFIDEAQNVSEIDLVEETVDGVRLSAFEFNWNPGKKQRLPKLFLETYPQAETGVITPENVQEFLVG